MTKHVYFQVPICARKVESSILDTYSNYPETPWFLLDDLNEVAESVRTIFLQTPYSVSVHRYSIFANYFCRTPFDSAQLIIDS